MRKLSDSSPLGLNIFDIGIITKSTSLSALAKSSFLRQKSPDLGHSVKMSFYCRILYIKFFDYGVSPDRSADPLDRGAETAAS